MRIGVIGAGAWGTALAQAAASGGEDVILWAREADVIDSINADHVNAVFLPKVRLSTAVRATGDLSDLEQADALLVVVPAQHVGTVLSGITVGTRPLVLCAKGIEVRTRRLVSEIAADAQPQAPLAVLSGPTFAHEVAAGLPTAVTLACADAVLREALSERLATPALRPYASDDVVGAEIGGAVKNVLAIACGVVDGAGLGQNARAALIARGFAEMTRYGVARGARPETLAGLSGLGDLVLTCSSTSSRNFSLGVGIGQGRSAAAMMSDRRTVAEGAFTAPVLREDARLRGVEMPVTEAVCALLEGADVDAVVERLLARPLRPEA
ncbi:NAD(P)H-dependent glycerol-3-phosphate dehydrogenase [Sphingomonas sp.]|uniref:NAD(P)H-dependent glycerol-3-phosphate dehydrogenase n=1 Tax=Sphingomonas sp. TaxID=28214 RepID=UPI002CBA31C0|nr:NAD(P)H-dependent glycerol-3-phosphate dehydrogenase [Sphingomonas sp.]HTG37448.1 NAD(P)H-dependent glycerol-3-phosphate dehydrogenase [Sphingomonas sp.]